MLEKIGNNNIFKIILIPFILHLISKINDNSFITIVLRGKNIPFIILYLSSLFSSLILNLFFILLGLSLRYFIKTDIINNFFLLVVFFLYGFIALIQTCRVFSNKVEEENKLIDYVLNSSSSDDDSERPKIHIDDDKNEVEIELDTIKLDEIDDERRNNNFSNLRKKKYDSEKKIVSVGSFFSGICENLKMIISNELGEKIQIFNMGFSAKYMEIFYLILGSICGIIIINAITIIFGLKILQKRINNLFLFIELIFFMSFACYYIYSIYF
jgi:putative Ca2+/H+ antiporter (TMEM165/GDT1 family)